MDQHAAIIPSQWIHDSVEFGIPANLHAYKYSLFQGLVVTTTGFDLRILFYFPLMLCLWLDERYSIQTEIDTHGGIFERQLVCNHTDYLIVRNTSSEKYRSALQWNITVVNEYWLRDCLHYNSKLQLVLLSSSVELLNPMDYQNFEIVRGSHYQDRVVGTSTRSLQTSSHNSVTSASNSVFDKIPSLDSGRLCLET